MWVPETDQFPSLAVNTIVQSPQNANVFYAGTGGFSSDQSFTSFVQARRCVQVGG